MNSRNVAIINILLLGLSFLFVFSAFQTSAMFQTIVLRAAKDAPNSTFTGNGYTSLAIIYITFAFANWISPIVLVYISPKYSMFGSSVIYILFIASFLKPMNWSLYLASFLVGVAAAVLWTAQGNFLSLNSVTGTINRNTAIFWGVFQCSLIFGNIFQYFMFRNTSDITTKQLTIFYTVFIIFGCIGSIMMLFFRKPVAQFSESPEKLIESDPEAINEAGKFTPWQAFLQTIRLLGTSKMLLLLPIFAYAGFELTFFSNVYPTSVGQTQYFDDKAKGYVGLIGIMIGVGELTSSFGFNFLSKICKKFTPDLIVVIGLFSHIIAFYIIFLSLPSNSNEHPSLEPTYIIPRPALVIFCGYLLGVGDSVYNTVIMALLGDAYKGADSPSAFSLFYFLKSLASGIGFFYCKYLMMGWQLFILSITGLIGTISFIYVERKTRAMILSRNIEASVNPN